MGRDYETAAVELALERLVAAMGAGMERQSQLLEALRSRVVIEQAKGVLAERLSLDVESAFDVLRMAARRNGLEIHALAAEVVSSRDTPRPIVWALGQSDAPQTRRRDV